MGECVCCGATEDVFQKFGDWRCKYVVGCKDRVVQQSKVEQDRVRNALEIAADGGMIDGEHHKMWTIDQMVRALFGAPDNPGWEKRYGLWLAQFEEDDDGHQVNYWDAGTTP